MDVPNPDMQNIPFDVDPQDPDVTRKLIDITKQTLRKLTELRNELDELKRRL